MKHFLAILLTILSSAAAFAQSRTVCFKETSDPKEIRKQMSYYHRQIAKNPKDTVAYYSLGMCHYRLGEFKAAIADFDTLIAMDRIYSGGYSNRGICKLFSKDKTGACEDFRQSVAVGQDPKVMDGMTLSEYVKTNCGK